MQRNHAKGMGWLVVSTLLLTPTVVLGAIAEAQQVAAPIPVNGSGWTPWAILLSAILGAVTAIVAVAKHRITTQKQAAINFLLEIKSASNKENESCFMELVNKDKLLSILDAKTQVEENVKLSVRDYLNMYELLGVGISRHVLDENVCKSIIGDTLIKRWKQALPLAKKIRDDSQDDEFFENFEKLADRWKSVPGICEQPFYKRIWQEITIL